MKKSNNILWQVLAVIALVGFVAIACDNETIPSLDGKTALPAPANVRVDDAGKTAFNLKWDAVQGADKYELDIGGVLQQVSDSTVSYDLKALTFDPKVYPIRVRALAANGDKVYKDSAYSAPLNVEPAEYIFTTGNVSSSPSIRFVRSVARSVGGDGLTITGLTPYGQGLETIVIPSKIGSVTVTTIGANAFADNDVITSVKLPDTVTEILSGAFSNCTVLVVVVFVSAEPPVMANDVFEGSNALETIIVPEGSGSAYAEAIEEAAPALAGKIEEAKPESFSITINTANGGRITTDPQGNVAANTTVTINVYPNQGYTLDKISVTYGADGNAVNVQQNTSGGYFFTMPASDVTISGSFTSEPTPPQPSEYKINIYSSPEVGGTIRTNPQGNAEANTTVTINVYPNQGYTLDKISVTDANNKAVNYQQNTSGGYFFTMPSSDVTISGSFTSGSTGGGTPGPGDGGGSAHYKITINTGSAGTTGGSGSISTYPDGNAEAGANVNVFINADDGYTLASLSITSNGSSVNYQTLTDTQIGSTYYSFTMPAANVTISGSFTEKK